jgi:hypothetical protein
MLTKRWAVGFESSHVLQQLVAGEATWQENQTNVIELLRADVATVSRRLPTSNRTGGWTTARSEASCSSNPGVRPIPTGRSRGGYLRGPGLPDQ